jgi:[heparan sulfate]-glucosamine 3-sulfotransferase 5
MKKIKNRNFKFGTFLFLLIMILFIRSKPKLNKLTQKLPNTLIIGAPKCGTTTLLWFFSEHPRVASAKEEQHFFNKNQNYMKGLDWYRLQMPFSNENQITLEKTPNYFMHEESPERVYALNNNMKLIVILCDPSKRAVSSYSHQKYLFINNGSCWEPNLQNLFSEYSHNIGNDELIFRSYLNRESFNKSTMYFDGLYYENYKRWLKYFPKENFLFLNGERFKKEPFVEIDKLQSFLGLEPFFRKEHFVFNKTKEFYCIKNPNTSKIKCMGHNTGRKQPAIDESILDKLRFMYRLDNYKFFKLLDENMKPWWRI